MSERGGDGLALGAGWRSASCCFWFNISDGVRNGFWMIVTPCIPALEGGRSADLALILRGEACGRKLKPSRRLPEYKLDERCARNGANTGPGIVNGRMVEGAPLPSYANADAGNCTARSLIGFAWMLSLSPPVLRSSSRSSSPSRFAIVFLLSTSLFFQGLYIGVVDM